MKPNKKTQLRGMNVHTAIYNISEQETTPLDYRNWLKNTVSMCRIQFIVIFRIKVEKRK